MKKENSQLEVSAKEFEKLGRDMWNVYELNYKNRKRMYFFIFTKGVLYGFGLFLGGTIVVAILVYSLSFFDEVPFVNKLYRALTEPTSLQQEKP